VSSRAGTRIGTVRMNFALAPPGVLYLLTSAFSRKAERWESDPWVRLRAPGSGETAEGRVRRVSPAELDAAAGEMILERFTAAGAASSEALTEMLEAGTHALFRVEGAGRQRSGA